jgi:hypothetical protein
LNNIVTLPINASNVNYTKSDLTTVSLNTYINDVVNDIHATIDHINKIFTLSAADVNYINENEVTKTVQARLREIDDFDQTEVLKNISDITENVNDTIENVKDIAESVENVAKIAGVAVGDAEVAQAATVAVAALEGNLGKEIAAAAGVVGSAVVSIGILGETVANLNVTQVIYIKTDVSTVTLDEHLKNIVSDIEATGDHVSQSLATLESNALTIEKINEINPLLGIDEYYNGSPPNKNEKLFQYYKTWSTSQEKFISIAVEVQINHDIYNGCLFRINKADNQIKIGNEIQKYVDPAYIIDYETLTEIGGRVIIRNESGLTLQSSILGNEFTTLINRQNNVSFMKNYQYSNNSIDIIPAKGLRTSITNNEVVFHKPGDTITDNSSQNQVKLPFGMNLSNLVTRISYLELNGPNLVVAVIKTANPYIGIDEHYALGQYDYIPTAKDEKIFQYYKKSYRGAISEFGVIVRAYTDIDRINLFNINKYNNQIYIGCNKSLVTSGTRIRGNLYFEKDNFPKENIILAKGLRTSVSDNEVVFHKPGDTITDNSSPNQVKLPFKTDLTNYNKTAFRQSIIDHTLINNPNGNLFQTITYSQITNEIGGDLNDYYQHCVNILSNVFISYT